MTETLADYERQAAERRQRAAARARARRTSPDPLIHALAAVTDRLTTMPATTDEECSELAAQLLVDLMEAGWTPPYEPTRNS